MADVKIVKDSTDRARAEAALQNFLNAGLLKAEFISLTTSDPSSTGAVQGSKGLRKKANGDMEIIEWDGSAWNSDGDVFAGAPRNQELENRQTEVETRQSNVEARQDDVETLVDVLQDGQVRGFIGYATKADMAADLAQEDKTVALVANDSTAANNGYYRKDGASGAGSWVKRDDFYATELDPDDTSEAVTGKAVGGYSAKKEDVSDFGIIKGADSNFYKNDLRWEHQLGTPPFDANVTVPNKLYIDFTSGNEAIYIQDILTAGEEYTVIIKHKLNAGTATELVAGKMSASGSGRVTFTPTLEETETKQTITADITYFALGCVTANNNGSAYEFSRIEVWRGSELVYSIRDRVNKLEDKVKDVHPLFDYENDSGSEVPKLEEFFQDLVIIGGTVGKNPGYGPRIIKRNSAGFWQIRIYLEDGSITEVLNYTTTSAPSNNIELIELSEVGSSGMKGYAIIKWDAVADGYDESNLYASNGYRFDDSIIQKYVDHTQIEALKASTASNTSVSSDNKTRIDKDLKTIFDPEKSSGSEVPTLESFIRDIVLIGADPAVDYSPRVVRRNASGVWQVRIYRNVNTSYGVEVASYNSGFAPPQDVHLLKLSELNDSGIFGYAIVDWSKLPDGYDKVALWASSGYRFDNSLFKQSIAYALLENVYGKKMLNKLNLRLGDGAGESLTTGTDNNFVGHGSGKNAKDAIGNTGVGNYTLEELIDGFYNVTIGERSQRKNKYGHRDTSVGTDSLFNHIIGNYLVSMGYQNQFSSIAAVRNTGVGYKGLLNNRFGFDNTQFGYKALENLDARGNEITSFTDNGDGTVTVTSTGHGLSNGEDVTILGTGEWANHEYGLNYDGTYTISGVTTNTFDITTAFIAEENLLMLGWWTIDLEASDNTAVGFAALNALLRGSGNIGIGKGAEVPDPNGDNQLSLANALYAHLSEKYFGFDVQDPKSTIHNGGAYTQDAMSSDPDDPAPGSSIEWVSDGTESGDAGDVMMKINVGGTVKTVTLVDYSAQ